MKRSIAFVLVLIFFFASTGCSSYDYDGWNTLTIDSCGTIRVPQEWTSYEKDGLLYILDKNQSPIMIETHSYSGFEENEQGTMESNDFYENLVSSRTLSSSVLSNGAIYGEVLMQCGEAKTQNYYLELGYDQRILLVVWDNTIDENTIKKIAASFVAV